MFDDRQRILASSEGEWVFVRKIVPCGSLEALHGKRGINFYFRAYFKGKTNRFAIGRFDPNHPRMAINPSRIGYSIEGAARVAAQMADKHLEYEAKGGYSVYLKEQKALKRQEALISNLNQSAEKEVVEGEAVLTLGNLLAAYMDYLKSKGRVSAHSVRTDLDKNVFKTHPAIIDMPANQITPDEIALILRSIHERGHGRTANKIRSYLHAAFTLAMQAKYNPSLPKHFISFNAVMNPVAVISPDTASNRADKNPLAGEEMLRYWRIIDQYPEPHIKASLKLHLLLGAPRIAQLVRLQWKDVHHSYLVLQDGKGKPGKPPRPHHLPLIEPVKVILAEMPRLSERVFGSSKAPMTATTLSDWAKKAVDGQIQNFTLKRTRSGVETLLASLKVSQEVRGYLQSHGIGGVQNKHYNAYEFLDEKAEALNKLHHYLQSTDSL